MAKAKIKHYSLNNILKKNALFNIIYGGRYSGKSYDCKRYCIEDFYKTGHETAYIRRWKDDINAPAVTRYFADSDVLGFTNNEYNMIDAGRGRLEISKYNSITEQKSNRKTFGYYFAINTASRYASQQFPNVRNIIIEEFIPVDGRYVDDEMELLFHVLSTIVREHDDCKIFLICNSISRQSIYWEEFGIAELIRRQEIGDIDVVERDTKAGKQRIAVEYARPSVVGNKLFSGQRETMTVEGRWLADPHPKIDDLKKWRCICTFYVEYIQAKFKCSYLVRNSEYTIYVEPYEKDTYPKQARIISDKFSFNPYVTNGFNAVSDVEAAIFRDIPDKCCYSDDLTGTEFEEILINFAKSY